MLALFAILLIILVAGFKFMGSDATRTTRMPCINQRRDLARETEKTGFSPHF
jgi:hypothetical protein